MGYPSGKKKKYFQDISWVFFLAIGKQSRRKETILNKSRQEKILPRQSVLTSLFSPVGHIQVENSGQMKLLSSVPLDFVFVTVRLSVGHSVSPWTLVYI